MMVIPPLKEKKNSLVEKGKKKNLEKIIGQYIMNRILSEFFKISLTFEIQGP